MICFREIELSKFWFPNHHPSKKDHFSEFTVCWSSPDATVCVCIECTSGKIYPCREKKKKKWFDQLKKKFCDITHMFLLNSIHFSNYIYAYDILPNNSIPNPKLNQNLIHIIP